MKDKKHNSLVVSIIRLILISLNIVCAVCLLLSGLTAYVNPNIWLLPSYLGLGFVILLGLNVCFTLMWIIFRKAWFLFSLCVMLLLFVPIRNTFSHIRKTESTSTQKQITLLSYNAMCSASFTKPTRKNPNKVLTYIAQTDADVVCLQEFGVHKNSNYLTLSDVKKQLSAYPYNYIYYRVNNRRHQIGVAIFSKYPLVHKHAIDYDSRFNASICCDLVVKNDTIRLINNHLESNRLTEEDINSPENLQQNLNAKAIGGYADQLTDKLSVAYKKRAQQAKIVAQIIAESPYPVVSCGDFNDVPVSYTYHTIRGKLNDAFVECAPFGLGNTYVRKWLHVRIDYILHSKSLNASDFKIDKSNFSDHYPVRCRLSW